MALEFEQLLLLFSYLFILLLLVTFRNYPYLKMLFLRNFCKNRYFPYTLKFWSNWNLSKVWKVSPPGCS